MNVKKHKNTIKLVLIILLTIVILSAYTIIDVLNRSRSGEEYAKKWVCDDFKITFMSFEEKFPHTPNRYSAQIEINNEPRDVIINTNSDTFTIGTEGEIYYDSKGMPCADFYTIASGNAYYNGFNYIVRINSVQDKEFEYLMSQVLIFSRIE